jgi:hypothetical protein
MHLGKQHGFRQFIGWTRWEAGYLIVWSLSRPSTHGQDHPFRFAPVPVA